MRKRRNERGESAANSPLLRAVPLFVIILHPLPYYWSVLFFITLSRKTLAIKLQVLSIVFELVRQLLLMSSASSSPSSSPLLNSLCRNFRIRYSLDRFLFTRFVKWNDEGKEIVSVRHPHHSPPQFMINFRVVEQASNDFFCWNVAGDQGRVFVIPIVRLGFSEVADGFQCSLCESQNLFFV